MVREAIILAAGNAAGFYPLSDIVPKTLVVVAGKTLLEHQLEWLHKWGIESVVVALQGKHQKAVEDFIMEKKLNIVLWVDPRPPGSAGSVRGAKSLLLDKYFLVLNCDDITNVNVEDLCSIGSPCVSIAPYRLRYGVVEVNSDSKVNLFDEKPVLPYRVNCGCYLLSDDIDYPHGSSLEKIVLPRLVGEKKLKAYKHDGVWWTINSWRDIKEVEEKLAALTYRY